MKNLNYLHLLLRSKYVYFKVFTIKLANSFNKIFVKTIKIKKTKTLV